MKDHSIQVSAAFDGGNIEVLSAERPDAIRLAIKKDNQSDFYQWFYFRVTGARGADLVMAITNAGSAAYQEGWPGYRACASYDRRFWFRVDTRYDGKSLTLRHRAEGDVIYFAYFAPFSMEQHHDLIARACASAHVRLHVLGRTLDGQDLDLLEIADPQAQVPLKNCWFIARQHPGESMAEWWMDGAIARLLDPTDPVTNALLKKARIFLVPNMNPDGASRGHLRTNAAGINLNRAWEDPSMATSPEVFLVRSAMEATGVDFHMDVHGDEALPYNFMAGFEGIPTLRDKQARLYQQFLHHLDRLSPDFQTKEGYPIDAAGTSDLRKCTDWTAERFGCSAMTLEMPFKDNALMPNETTGWSPDRCRHLARHCLEALLQIIDDL